MDLSHYRSPPPVAAAPSPPPPPALGAFLLLSPPLPVTPFPPKNPQQWLRPTPGEPEVSAQKSSPPALSSASSSLTGTSTPSSAGVPGVQRHQNEVTESWTHRSPRAPNSCPHPHALLAGVP